MDAYSQVRHDVTSVYDDVLAKHERDSMQEGAGVPDLVPTLSVSGSQPAWLGEQERRVLAGAAGLGALGGLALMVALVDESAAAASTAGGFAIVSLLVAYLTVAGFGTVAFSIGSGIEPDEGREQEGGAGERKRSLPRRTSRTADARSRLDVGARSPG